MLSSSSAWAKGPPSNFTEGKYPAPSSQSTTYSTDVEPFLVPLHKPPEHSTKPVSIQNPENTEQIRTILTFCQSQSYLPPDVLRSLAALAAQHDLPPPILDSEKSDLDRLEEATRERLATSDYTAVESLSAITADGVPARTAYQMVETLQKQNTCLPTAEPFLITPTNFCHKTETKSAESLVILPSSFLPGERGVFSTRKIKTGTKICQYAGPIVRIKHYEEGVKQKLYPDFRKTLHIQTEMDLHGAGGFPNCSIFGLQDTFGATINHSNEPNCSANFKRTDSVASFHYNLISIVALREIAKGEELTMNYGSAMAPLLKTPEQSLCQVCCKPCDYQCPGVLSSRRCWKGYHPECLNIPKDMSLSQLHLLHCGVCLERLTRPPYEDPKKPF
jgi:hypothetical protein